MATSALGNLPAHADGAALEAISDAIDTVNRLKAALASPQRDENFLTPPRGATPSPTDAFTVNKLNTAHGSKRHQVEPLTPPPEPAALTPTPTITDETTAFDASPKFDAEKDKSTFRDYEAARGRVKAFYAEQHASQTVAHNLAMRERFHSASRVRPELTIWEAIEKLNSLVDESDPDTELSQIQHLLQSAEAIRRDGKPRWMQVTGLIHDLGKLMLFFEGLSTSQWDVVGDTFPVGCQFSERCIYPDTFRNNPDYNHEQYGTKLGIYKEGCGLDQLIMSWGHDEYLYLVLRDQSTLPREALAMVRYHSFYPWHKGGAYREFMKGGDEDLLKAVQAFNPYDLYSKTDEVPKVEELKPYYLKLIDEFFPQKVIKW